MFLDTCVRCAGFVGTRSELELQPLVRVAVEEVVGPSREPCTFAVPKPRERTYCGIEATQDVPSCRAGVGKSVHMCE